MDTRFEDDLIEIAAGGGYLMACRERRLVFVDGAERSPLPVDDVRGVRVLGSVLEISTVHGAVSCALPGVTEAALEPVAERLGAALEAWRGVR